MIGKDAYQGFLKKEIEYSILQQEEIGLDVLVHGEAEHTDMVEYFGELLPRDSRSPRMDGCRATGPGA